MNKKANYKIRAEVYDESQKTDNQSSVLFENLIWMTSDEAASYIRKSTGALRTAVCRGQIKAKKFHRRLYFKKKDLDYLLESSQTIGGY